jgi:predicted metal-binding membrane protein
MGLRALLPVLVRAPWPGLLAVSAGGMTLFRVYASEVNGPSLCTSLAGLPEPGAWFKSAEAALLLSSPGRLLGEWALMLLAMMPPLLAMPLMHVWRSSSMRKRASVAATFLLGYAATWMIAGPVLIGLALLIQGGLGEQAWFAVLVAALVWSSSPLQRQSLNKAHRLKRIGLFGLTAYADAFAFGATHGGWCIGSCWAWMLLPLISGSWHLAAMVAGGTVMLLERLSPSNQPRWHLPVALKWLQDLLKNLNQNGTKVHG